MLTGFYCFIKSGYFEIILNWISTLSWFGNILLVLLYIVISLPFAIGYAVLSLSCGLIYGLWIGWLTIVIGACAGFTASFLLCRKFLRDWTRNKISKNRQLKSILIAIEAHPSKFTILMRYTPVPFGLQNAICAVADIPFETYFIASLFAMLPEAFFWAYFGGTTARSITDIVEGKAVFGVGEYIALSVELVILIVVIILSVVIGKRAINHITKEVSRGSDLETLELTDFAEGEKRDVSPVLGDDK